MGFQDQEDDVLLARAGDAFLDAEFVGELQQFVRRLALEFVEIDQRTVAAAVAGIVGILIGVLLRLEALLVVVAAAGAARLVVVALIAMAVAVASAALTLTVVAALLALFAAGFVGILIWRFVAAAFAGADGVGAARFGRRILLLATATARLLGAFVGGIAGFGIILGLVIGFGHGMTSHGAPWKRAVGR